MIDKTKAGRTKNVSCPYCAQMFYSIHTLNVHIAYKHPGERTVTPNNTTKRLEPYKKPKPQPRAEHKEKREVLDYGSQEEDEDDDDPY